jgi:hypothetical protein
VEGIDKTVDLDIFAKMITMTSTEARTNFGDFLDKGSKEAVIIKRQRREIGAFIPIDEYRRLRKLSIRELNETARHVSEQASERGLTEEKLNAILEEINPS